MSEKPKNNWKSRLRYFPCVQKQPRDKGWQQQATSDVAQVEKWRSENINLGIACGAESDVFVLDIDVKKANGYETLRQLEEKHEPLPNTHTVRTPTKGGHKYFKHPHAARLKNAVEFLPGLDIRTEGGLVIAAGGRTEKGAYECAIDAEPAEAPAWLIKEILSGQQQQKAAAQQTPAEITEGGRNRYLFERGSAMRAAGFVKGAILDALLKQNQEMCKPPLPEAEVRITAASAAKYPPDSEEVIIPPDVDFSLSLDAEAAVSRIPDNAMYGNAARLASMLRCPMGFAYPAVLAAIAAVGFPDTSNVRPTLYVGLLGGVGSGKSVTRDRATKLFDISSRVIVHTPSSDRGLQKLLAEKEAGASCLISADEMRTMMAKGAIENSTLVPLLCELWSSTTAGSADKTGNHGINVRLNILGCLKIDDPSEFPDVFGFATAHGFYDRCLLGLRADEPWKFTPMEMTPVPFNPSRPSIPGHIYERMHAWCDEIADPRKRGRLGEHALRVALITSAANSDSQVTDESLDAALRFMQWQEKIREVYQPAKGANEWQECAQVVEKAFENAPGKAAKWRDICQKNNWYRKYRCLKQVKQSLEEAGVIAKDKTSGKHYLAKERNKK